MGVKAKLKGVRKAAALLPQQKDKNGQPVDHYKRMKDLLMKDGPEAASKYFWGIREDEQRAALDKQAKQHALEERNRLNRMKMAVLKDDRLKNKEAYQSNRKLWTTQTLSRMRSLLQWLSKPLMQFFGKA